MEQLLENDFDILYENNSTSNYFVLRTGIDKSLINYQVQMLLNNKLNGLLDFNINYMGDYINCFYDVTSKCTLASFMSRKRFSRNEFLITILNIINNIYQMESYLLYDNNILLDENYIYVEPENIDIYFVYMPFAECRNDIKAFFIKLIFKLAKFYDEDSDNYFQKILEVIKSELFNLSALKTLIEKLLGEEIKNQTSSDLTIDVSNNTEANEFVNRRNKVENLLDFKANTDFIENEKRGTDKLKSMLKVDKTKDNKGKNEKFNKDKIKEEKIRADKVVITKANIRIPNSQNIKEKEKKSFNKDIKTKEPIHIRNAKSVDQNRNNGFFSLGLILLQIFLLTVFILIVNSNIVKMSDEPKTTVIILLMILVFVDILFIRIINDKRKKSDELSSKPMQFIVNKMRSGLKNKDDDSCNSTNYKEEVPLPTVNSSYNGETVILKKARPTEKPYLKEKDGEEVIEIDKKSLLIGRMESFVDYVINSNAIGKIHAEIIDEEGEFYVMDCNSRNGTFLNDSRIVPNIKNKVGNNDVLRFANKEFIFLYPVELQSRIT